MKPTLKYSEKGTSCFFGTRSRHLFDNVDVDHLLKKMARENIVVCGLLVVLAGIVTFLVCLLLPFKRL